MAGKGTIPIALGHLQVYCNILDMNECPFKYFRMFTILVLFVSPFISGE